MTDIPEHDKVLEALEREARRKLAASGGRGRKASMSPEARSKAARAAVVARWAKSAAERAEHRKRKAQLLIELREEKRRNPRKRSFRGRTDI